MEKLMRNLLLTCATAATAIAAATLLASSSAQAMTLATPAQLGVAGQDANVKQVQCGCGGYAYYQPYAYY